MVVASRPSQVKRTYQRRSSGSYSDHLDRTTRPRPDPPGVWRRARAPDRPRSGLAALDRRAGRRGRRSDDGAVRRRCSTVSASTAPTPRLASGRSRVAQHPVDERGVRGWIALGDEIPRDAVVDEVAQPTDVGRDHRRAARGGFQRDETERLGTTTAPRTGRRRGRSRRAGRAVAARRTARGARARGRRPARAATRPRPRPSGPLGPPTITSVARCWSSSARPRAPRGRRPSAVAADRRR